MKRHVITIKPHVDGWQVVERVWSRSSHIEKILHITPFRDDAERLAEQAAEGREVMVIERAKSSHPCPTCGQEMPR